MAGQVIALDQDVAQDEIRGELEFSLPVKVAGSGNANYPVLLSGSLEQDLVLQLQDFVEWICG